MDELATYAAELLSQEPFCQGDRAFLDGEELLAVARARLAQRKSKPVQVRKWLNAVAHDCLLDALLHLDLSKDAVAAAVFGKQLRLLVGGAIERLGGSRLPEAGVTDVVQSTYRRLAEFRKENTCLPPNPVGWLKTTALNRCRELWRRHSRRRTGSLDETTEPAASEQAPAGQELSNRDEVERILQGAGEVEQAIIRLHYWEGLRMAEVAEALGMTKNAVEVRLHRWKRRVMRDRFGGDVEPA